MKYMVTYNHKTTGKFVQAIANSNTARIKKIAALKEAGHKNVQSREYMA